MKKSTQKVLDPKKDVLTRLKHLRALLGEARAAALGSGHCPRAGGVVGAETGRAWSGGGGRPTPSLGLGLVPGKAGSLALRCELPPDSHRGTSRRDTAVIIPSPAHTGPRCPSHTCWTVISASNFRIFESGTLSRLRPQVVLN